MGGFYHWVFRKYAMVPPAYPEGTPRVPQGFTRLPLGNTQLSLESPYPPVPAEPNILYSRERFVDIVCWTVCVDCFYGSGDKLRF